MSSIFIFGSCVSRDILEIASLKGLTLTDYYARSSFASLAGRPYTDHEALERLDSPFQKRILARDHDKSIFEAVQQASFDILLVDFIDERFRITRRPDGSIATMSNEFVRVMSEREDSEVIETNTDERRSLWLAGWKKFIDVIAATRQMEKIVINRVYWDTSYDRPRPGTPYIERMNDELDWYYEEVAESCPDAQWLSHPAPLLKSDSQHKWGPAPYHYSKEFYERSMRELIAIGT
ncbi:DUF6270 domain-containing protein [Pseudophaeobacter sp.]|uniref:DUF6270 domain-containing protein n=1 Tax=Pseudophaeobacter sp. TaxID=1971739 RepID=UPI003A978D06